MRFARTGLLTCLANRHEVKAQVGPLQPPDAQATIACAWELGR